MNEKWSLREYMDGDEENINPLLNSVYKLNRGLSYWDWEFKNNPEDVKILLAVDGARIVGHLAALNRTVKIDGGDVPASLEVEGVTHPEYQRKGIFVGLGKRLLSDLQKDGAALVYGFPNEKALPGHRKLNCIELFSLHVMIRPVNFKNISKKMATNRILGFFANMAGKLTFKLFYRPKRPRVGKDVIIKTVHEFDSRVDQLWETAQKHHKIILRRDAEYLNWRYTKCPEKQYIIYIAERNNEIMGWIVVRIMEKFGLKNGALVDLLALPDCNDVLHALITKAVEDLKKRGVDLVACSVPKSGNYYEILRRSGFMTCPKKLNPKEEPFIIYPLSQNKNVKLIKEPDNWFMTWGDTDVV